MALARVSLLFPPDPCNAGERRLSAEPSARSTEGDLQLKGVNQLPARPSPAELGSPQPLSLVGTLPPVPAFRAEGVVSLGAAPST